MMTLQEVENFRPGLEAIQGFAGQLCDCAIVPKPISDDADLVPVFVVKVFSMNSMKDGSDNL